MNLDERRKIGGIRRRREGRIVHDRDRGLWCERLRWSIRILRVFDFAYAIIPISDRKSTGMTGLTGIENVNEAGIIGSLRSVRFTTEDENLVLPSRHRVTRTTGRSRPHVLEHEPSLRCAILVNQMSRMKKRKTDW